MSKGYYTEFARKLVVKYRLLAGDGYDISEKSRLFARIVSSLHEEDRNSYFSLMLNPEIILNKLADFLTTCPCEEYSYQKHTATWSNIGDSSADDVREMLGKLSPDYNDRTKEHYKDGFRAVFLAIERDYNDMKLDVEERFAESQKAGVLQDLKELYAKNLDQSLARKALVKIEEYKIRAGSTYDQSLYDQDLDKIKVTFTLANYQEIEADWKAIVNEARDNVLSPPLSPVSWELRSRIQPFEKIKPISGSKKDQKNHKVVLGDEDGQDSPRGHSEVSFSVPLSRSYNHNHRK